MPNVWLKSAAPGGKEFCVPTEEIVAAVPLAGGTVAIKMSGGRHSYEHLVTLESATAARIRLT
jgi:hypothetical protein